jgi:hypothetical protein
VNHLLVLGIRIKARSHRVFVREPREGSSRNGKQKFVGQVFLVRLWPNELIAKALVEIKFEQILLSLTVGPEEMGG